MSNLEMVKYLELRARIAHVIIALLIVTMILLVANGHNTWMVITAIVAIAVWRIGRGYTKEADHYACLAPNPRKSGGMQ